MAPPVVSHRDTRGSCNTYPDGRRIARDQELQGLAGKHSIRINDQWRVVFRWTDAGPEDVEIIDYH
jgi:toxin HigB-1